MLKVVVLFFFFLQLQRWLETKQAPVMNRRGSKRPETSNVGAPSCSGVLGDFISTTRVKKKANRSSQQKSHLAGQVKKSGGKGNLTVFYACSISPFFLASVSRNTVDNGQHTLPENPQSSSVDATDEPENDLIRTPCTDYVRARAEDPPDSSHIYVCTSERVSKSVQSLITWHHAWCHVTRLSVKLFLETMERRKDLFNDRSGYVSVIVSGTFFTVAAKHML